MQPHEIPSHTQSLYIFRNGIQPKGRSRARLACRHEGRRKSARVALRTLSGCHPVHSRPPPGDGVSRHRAVAHQDVLHPAPAVRPPPLQVFPASLPFGLAGARRQRLRCGDIALSREDEGFYLIVSALVPYKRIDVAVEAFTNLGRRLVVVGAGPEEKRLRSLAGGNVEFKGWAPDAELAGYFARCRALVFPSEEAFGIAPVEAMSCGKPVIAFAAGGALETRSEERRVG